jgi:hypothetical protein
MLLRPERLFHHKDIYLPENRQNERADLFQEGF